MTLLLVMTSCDEPVDITDVSGDDFQEIEYPCLTSSEDCINTLNVKGGTFRFFSSFHIDSLSDVSGAIISVHGNNRGGDNYFDKMIAVTSDLGMSDDVLVIAPKFITQYEQSIDTDLYWNTTSWKWGLQSYSNVIGERVSSFELIDTLLNRLTNKTFFPQMENILITGMSSGAAFVQMFSASKENNDYNDVDIHFAVVNSQYFIHPDPLRLMSDGSLSVPENCDSYNDWPLGLDELSIYMDSYGKEQLKSKFLSNSVQYFIGENDTSTDNITNGCQYEFILGSNRYDKNINFISYLDTLYPSNQHQLTVIPNIGHSTNAFSSNIFNGYLNTIF